MQPSLAQMVGMLPAARRAVRTTSSNTTRYWAQHIVEQCYDRIRDWKYLVEEISLALKNKTWPIGQIDAEDTTAFIDYFVCVQDKATRRDREAIPRTFLEGVFNKRPGA